MEALHELSLIHILFGRELPRGNDQELLDEALKVAAQADVIVAALGESSEMRGESSSRYDLEMPDAQRHLLEALDVYKRQVCFWTTTADCICTMAPAMNIP